MPAEDVCACMLKLYSAFCGCMKPEKVAFVTNVLFNWLLLRFHDSLAECISRISCGTDDRSQQQFLRKFAVGS